VRRARAVKAEVCREDPYERTGLRALLNFGHTYGHAIESLTRFRTSHGDAVALGMLVALDVGTALRVTPRALSAEVEAVLRDVVQAPGRVELDRIVRRADPEELAGLLAADKKTGAKGELKMVLLKGVGRAFLRVVKPSFDGLFPE
jgi:3-dehydroquinate synthase